MSDKHTKMPRIAAGVLPVGFVGDWRGSWDTTPWIPTGGPEGGQ